MNTKPILCERGPTPGSSLSKCSLLIARHSVLYLALCSLLLAPCFPAEAQQPAEKVSLIGVLSSSTAADTRIKASLDTLRAGLRELGHVEAKNLSFEPRFAERNRDRLAGLAEELVGLKVDILFAIDTDSASAAKQATSTIPIVIATGGDPVRNKLVASLARPGGNITGLTTDSPRLVEKRLGLLKEAAPKITRVGFLMPPIAGARAGFDESQPTAKSLGVSFQAVEVKAPNPDFEGAFQFMVKERIEGLVTEGPPLISANRKRILQLANKHRIPAIHVDQIWANEGGLMSYGANRVEPFRRAAVFIDKILKGAKPAELPVEQPTKFEFVLNLITAKQIGLTIPPNVLARADRVIK